MAAARPMPRVAFFHMDELLLQWPLLLYRVTSEKRKNYRSRADPNHPKPENSNLTLLQTVQQICQMDVRQIDLGKCIGPIPYLNAAVCAAVGENRVS